MVAALALGGCGGSKAIVPSSGIGVSPTAPSTTSVTSREQSPEQTQRGYLSGASNGVLFIQWTRTGGTVTGTFSEAYIDPSSPTQVQTESDSFTGIISGSSVTLNLGDVHWTGTLNGSTLILNHSASDGSIMTSTFQPATVAEYDANVLATHRHANQNAANQKQQQQANNVQILDNEASGVTSAISNLSGAVSSLSSDVPAGASTLTGERSDVATAYHDLQVTRSASTDEVCGDADTTQGDADTVQGDVDTEQGDDDTFNGDLQSVMSDVSQLRSDNAQFRHNLAVVGNYTPAGTPDAQAVSRAILSAQAAEAQGERTLASDMQTAKQLLQQANSYSTQSSGCLHPARGVIEMS